MAAGIETRHARSCRSRDGRRCDCEPTYRAHVWDGRTSRRIRRTFATEAEAKGWRHDALIALRRGRKVAARNTTTVRQSAGEWKRLAEAGVLRPRSGELYKPSTVRTYDQHLRARVLDQYGDEPLADVSRADWQALVDDLLADGVAAATVEATVAAVAALYRREIELDRLKVNSTAGLRLPAASNGRDRYASPEEAGRLLQALPESDRPVWATAMYAGLRCGELQALRACDVQLDDGIIDVGHGWDRREGRIATKGRKRRKVPIAAVLREPLAAHLLRTGRRGDDLAFGATDHAPFASQTLQRRADIAWEGAGLDRLTPHDCRHTYASLMIAAGVNAKALSTYMGHSSIQITFDRYGHLFPGNEGEAAGLLDTYLEARAG